MVGKGASSASVSTNPSAAVCCMCGDHGLPQELFRCKRCIFRSQHKYCSDLYPKEERYRVCNWCLREEGGKSFAWENNISVSSPSSNGGTYQGGGLGGPTGLLVTARQAHQEAEAAQEAVLRCERADAIGGALARSTSECEALASARPAFRGKARRYKLLEEVSM